MSLRFGTSLSLLEKLVSIATNYIFVDTEEGGLTGGTIWTRSQKPELAMPDPRAQFQPRHIPILKGDKPYVDELRAVRVSNDGVLGAIVLENMEIFIYKFIEADGNLTTEKKAKKPVKIIKVTFGHLRKVIDLFIFKQKQEKEGSPKYHMYLLFENGIVLIQDIADRADQTILLDDTKDNQGIHLTMHCSDIDYEKGVLLVEVT